MGEIDRTDLDRLLLANANKSIEEISELTGLSPEDAASRISELVRKRGALYELYREQMLLEELWSMKDELAERIKNSAERNTAGLANAWRQVTSLVLDRYDKARERNQIDLMRVDEYHAEILGRALSAALSEMINRLDLDEEQAAIVMEEVVPDSFEIIKDAE